jgi:prephenate dehydrogenase
MSFEIPTIGIIGDSGAMGRWLKEFFKKQGYFVVGSSLGSALSNRAVIEQSDVVIFAVTLELMIPVIKGLAPLSRPGQLWMDVGSRKQEIVAEMLTSRAEVVGLHPLCAPPARLSLVGETVAFCPARLVKWSDWVRQLMNRLKAKVLRCEEEYHDSMMLLTQNIPQAALLATARALAESGHDPEELVAFSTASSKKVLALIARMLANSPGVYADIQIGAGERGLTAIDTLMDSLRIIRKAIVDKDRGEIVLMFRELEKHFGEEFIAAGKSSFVKD